MDKREERGVFDAIFGRFGLTVEEGERPDFVCSHNSRALFGVEITEFFWTESDARLRNIENYVSDLISGGRYRHKDDVNEIKVEDVVYHVAATGQAIPLKAIGRRIPPHHLSVPRLMAAIAAKNAKATAYRQRVTPIDLIVADVEQVLRFDTIQQLLEPLVFAADSATISASPFREIYITTLSAQKGVVAVPLRANLFAGEIAFITAVFRCFREEIGDSATVGEYLNALAAYLVTRFPGIMYFAESGVPRFVFGSVSWGMTTDHHVQITDISCEDAAAWTPLAQHVDAAGLPSRLIEMIDERRGKEFFGYELYFEAALPAESSDQAEP